MPGIMEPARVWLLLGHERLCVVAGSWPIFDTTACVGGNEISHFSRANSRTGDAS